MYYSFQFKYIVIISHVFQSYTLSMLPEKVIPSSPLTQNKI